MIRGYIFSGIAIACLAAGIALRGINSTASITLLVSGGILALVHLAYGVNGLFKKWEEEGRLTPGQKPGLAIFFAGMATAFTAAVLDSLGLSRPIAYSIAWVGVAMIVLGIIAASLASRPDGSKKNDDTGLAFDRVTAVDYPTGRGEPVPGTGLTPLWVQIPPDPHP